MDGQRVNGAQLGQAMELGIEMQTAAPPAADERLIIERMPGGYLLSQDWGRKQSVCSTVAQLVKAVRAKYGPAK